MKKYQPDQKCLLMSRDEVRAFDAWAINELGIPGIVLMENAGRSCAELIAEKLSKTEKPKVCIFCGTGNNGGDGFVIARHLLNAGFDPSSWFAATAAKSKATPESISTYSSGLASKSNSWIWTHLTISIAEVKPCQRSQYDC